MIQATIHTEAFKIHLRMQLAAATRSIRELDLLCDIF